ncbi:hypothetical protein ACHAPJ_011727 [Fusarium lateritium]
MFCSAPDQGKFTDSLYPDGSRRDRFFRIGAAHAYGTVSDWTPEDGITYILPGVDVVKEQVKRSSSKTSSTQKVTNRVKSFEYETGSSIATALAAGLAAMIIYCIKASILAVKTANQRQYVMDSIPDNGAITITNHDAMKRAFASLGTVTTNDFIQVWERLDVMSEILERWQARKSNLEIKLECIADFTKHSQEIQRGDGINISSI